MTEQLLAFYTETKRQSQILHCKWNFMCRIAENVTEGLRWIDFIKNTCIWVVSAFKSGRDVVEDSPLSDLPSMSSTEFNIAKVKKWWLKIIVNEFLAKNSTDISEQPPYPPDMAPADSFLFPKLKLPLWGTRFPSIEDIKENSRRELKLIPEKNVLMIGLFVGISVLFREGYNSNVIK